MLPPEYQMIYENMVDSIAESKSLHDSSVLVGISPYRGVKSENKLMVVGRAPNGWPVSRTVEQLTEVTERKSFVKEALTLNTDKGICPLNWVIDLWGNTNPEEYNSARSAFWRVIKRIVVDKLGVGNDDNWSSHLIWSDLYKISFDAANPTWKLQNLQLEYCIKLLKMEFEMWQPEIILITTGMDWARCFIEQDKLGQISKYSEYPNDLVDTSFVLNNKSKVIVAKHPQGKPETEWVEQVWKVLSSI